MTVAHKENWKIDSKIDALVGAGSPRPLHVADLASPALLTIPLRCPLRYNKLRPVKIKHTLCPAPRPDNLGPLVAVRVHSSIKGMAGPVELGL